MKPKQEKKLGLGKEIIRNLDSVLERDEQKRVKGGTLPKPQGNTDVPFYCK
jgi:hypothetical protein